VRQNKNARQREIFVVRLRETHVKVLSLSCVSKQRTSKTNDPLLQGWRKKKLFAVRLIKDARQRFERHGKGRVSGSVQHPLAAQIPHLDSQIIGKITLNAN
jgi:hypothetical protein